MFISTAAKIRPSEQGESPFSLDIDDNIIKCTGSNTSHSFSRVYREDSQPYHIYRDAIAPLLEDFMSGYNICILLFGETGSGKSHAFAGNHVGDSVGIFQIIIDDLFQEIAAAQTNHLRSSRLQEVANNDNNKQLSNDRLSSDLNNEQHQLQLPTNGIPQRQTLSRQRTPPRIKSGSQIKDGLVKITMQFCELYNEKIHDLLQPESTTAKTLEINENEQKGIYVRGITNAPVNDEAQGIALFEEAWARRLNIETQFGSSNIRSSAILTITQTTVRGVLFL